MQSRQISRLSVGAVFILTALVSVPLAQAPRQPFSRIAIIVSPDHPDWTYQPGEPVTFRIDVLRDGHQASGATVKYSVGPEMMPPITESTATVGATSLTIDGGTMNELVLLRFIATA